MAGRLMEHPWRAAASLLGAVAGFAYYHYAGCPGTAGGGACPISGNPWISTVYGAVMGWLAVPRGQVRRPDAAPATQEHQKEQ